MVCRLVLILAIASATSAAASPRTVAGFALPTRSANAGELRAFAARLATEVAQRTGGRVVDVPRSSAGSEHLARAAALLLDANVDEAASTYDAALEVADRDPAVYVANDLIAAHVARAQIALAQGDNARADALLERVYSWDPAFVPTTDEATPAINDAVARLRVRAVSPLDASALGDSCRHADSTIVVRPTRDGRVELARFDGCVLATSTITSSMGDDARIVDQLAPRPPTHKASLVHRPWFWIAASAIALSVTGTVVWAATRDQGGLDVAIRF